MKKLFILVIILIGFKNLMAKNNHYELEKGLLSEVTLLTEQKVDNTFVKQNPPIKLSFTTNIPVTLGFFLLYLLM